MNSISTVMAERKEKMVQDVDVVKIGCIDEDDRVGNTVVKIGVAGSGVVKEFGGNESLYPIFERENMKEVATYIRRWAISFSNKLGIPVFTTSHPDCGAGNAQGFNEDELIKATGEISRTDEIAYAGHLKTSNLMEDTSQLSVKSWFSREKGLSHGASRMIITVGGGISGEEKAKMQQKLGKAFDISADWLSYSLNMGINKDTAVSTLLFQIQLAYSIAEGVRKNKDPFLTFDAGRLSGKEAKENISIVERVIEIAKENINLGNWKEASHH